MRLTHRSIESLQREARRAIMLFISDRCQVGCAHCNVDSRSDSPTISDFELYESILDFLAADPDLEVVTITGGEPFVERRGLALATRRLTAAGKHVAVVTSGVWAAFARVPGWIHDVLARCDCVYLSTSSYHAAQVDDASLINAAREITAAEAWLVLQVLDEDGARERGAELLNQAFGGRWDQHAELNVIAPLRQGRGAKLFMPSERLAGQSFGPCPLLRTPTIRYDGVVSACQNEELGLGLGPARLRRCAGAGAELGQALAGFRRDSALRVIGQAGFAKLLRHDDLRDLADARFSSNCELCWQALARLSGPGDPQIDKMAAELDEDT